MNAPDENPPCTPVKATGNGGAGRVDPDTENDSDLEDSGQEDVSKTKRKWNGRAEYTLLKKWVIGEEAEMESEDIDRELFELAREWMAVSKLKKLPGHIDNPTDVALWKQFREYTVKKGLVKIRIFRCPLRYRCKCKAGMRIMETSTWKSLERCGEHNATSHDEDHSKYLKHQQIVAVTDAVTIAPALSAAELRRNMQLADPNSPGKRIGPEMIRSMQRVVRLSRAELTVKQLQGFDINSTFGSLTQFSEVKWFRTLIDRNNNFDDDFHFDLFTPFVIGRGIDAKRDIVHINITSMWFLLNIFRLIACGWVFQLNADTTFSFCRAAVDMIGFGVNSVGNHNHPLCWSLIPHHTESEITYTGTFLELQEAALLVNDIHTCSQADCEFCNCLDELLSQERVVKFLEGDFFKAGKLPIDTAQCDNFHGFGNFTREVFGWDPNICKNHLLGTCFSPVPGSACH